MKKIYLLVLSIVALVACEGDQGLPGFDGRDGVDLRAQSFQVTLNFNAPDYSVIVPYNFAARVFPEDITLVYILFGEGVDNQGFTFDIWRLLPQTLYSDFGEYQYNYEFTDLDVRIFIDGPLSTNFDFLGPADLNNQIFRVVSIPIELASNPNFDVTDYQSVMELGGITDSDIITIE